MLKDFKFYKNFIDYLSFYLKIHLLLNFHVIMDLIVFQKQHRTYQISFMFYFCVSNQFNNCYFNCLSFSLKVNYLMNSKFKLYLLHFSLEGLVEKPGASQCTYYRHIYVSVKSSLILEKVRILHTELKLHVEKFCMLFATPVYSLLS